MDFYTKTIRQLLKDGAITLSDSVLVVCAGDFDVDTLHALGFTNVVISNLEKRHEGQLFSWSRQDAEALTFPDRSFDWVLVHAGLHHCVSPHKALIEMVRVARHGAIAFEARDSLLMRIAAKLGLAVDYELEAVAANKYTGGGLRGGPIPNFVYRWTEREVEKTIESAFPDRVNRIDYFYAVRSPDQRMELASVGRRAITKILWLGVAALHLFFPRQCNSFAFAIRCHGVKPWIKDHALSHEYNFGFHDVMKG